MRHPATRRVRSESGQSLVEFALVLPILALFLFGIIQFGIVFNNYVTLTDATRAGARKAAVGRFTANPTGNAETAVRTSADDLDQGKLQVTVDYGGAPTPGGDVTVTAKYPFDISLPGLKSLLAFSGFLTSKTTERVE